MNKYIYIYMYICVFSYVFIYVYRYAHLCIDVCVYICIHISRSYYHCNVEVNLRAMIAYLSYLEDLVSSYEYTGLGRF